MHCRFGSSSPLTRKAWLHRTRALLFSCPDFGDSQAGLAGPKRQLEVHPASQSPCRHLPDSVIPLFPWLIDVSFSRGRPTLHNGSWHGP
jgi:hypothetical protein